MGARHPIGTAILGFMLSALGLLAGIQIRDRRIVSGIWQQLDATARGSERFTADLVADLPSPAKRYFLHAIRPGTVLATRLHWRYAGSMTPGPGMPWLALQAEQLLVKNYGFVWKARARKGPLVLTATDHYLTGAGRMRIVLFGLIPIINASGPDLAKSALARLLIEGIALPSALLPGPNVQITGLDASRFTATVTLDGMSVPMTLTVDQDGRPTEIVLPRWGNLTPDKSFRSIPYGGTVSDERRFGGYTIPTRIDAGWWYGTEHYLKVVRLQVKWAQLD